MDVRGGVLETETDLYSLFCAYNQSIILLVVDHVLNAPAVP